MNYSMYILLAFCISLTAPAQVSRPVLSAGNHATLDSVKVSYEPVSTATVNTSAIYVKPEVLITLKPVATGTTIYLQVLGQDSSVVYAVNYATGTAAPGGGGQALFFGQGQRFHIICPVTVLLSTYIYKIYTRNAQGTNSSTFITKQ